MPEWYEFEDVVSKRLEIMPLTSRTWTVEIGPESVIMTREDLHDLASFLAGLLS